MMFLIPYDKRLKEFSQYLRNNSTLGEILLWQELKTGKLMGYIFNRQKPLGRFIVDFYCKPLNLVIEVDGGYHTRPEQKLADDIRQKILEDLGVNFLRFADIEVRRDVEQVIDKIKRYINEFRVN